MATDTINGRDAAVVAPAATSPGVTGGSPPAAPGRPTGLWILGILGIVLAIVAVIVSVMAFWRVTFPGPGPFAQAPYAVSGPTDGSGYGMGPGYGMQPGYGMGPGYGVQPGYGMGPYAGGAQQQAIVDALGMSQGDFIAARQSGKSVAELATERNVDLQTVIDAAAAQFRATVEAAVTAGRLNRAQGDAMLIDVETRIRDQFNSRTVMGPGYGYRGW